MIRPFELIEDGGKGGETWDGRDCGDGEDEKGDDFGDGCDQAKKFSTGIAKNLRATKKQKSEHYAVGKKGRFEGRTKSTSLSHLCSSQSSPSFANRMPASNPESRIQRQKAPVLFKQTAKATTAESSGVFDQFSRTRERKAGR